MKAFMQQKFKKLQLEYHAEKTRMNEHQSLNLTLVADSIQSGVQQQQSNSKIGKLEGETDSKSIAFGLNPRINLKMNSQPFVPNAPKEQFIPSEMVESSKPFFHSGHSSQPQSKFINQPVNSNYSDKSSQSSMSNSSSS